MNSLYREYGGINQQASGMKRLYDMILAAKNPQAALSQLMTQNPQMQKVYQFISENGGDAKTAFYKLAEQKGINPEEILTMLK